MAIIAEDRVLSATRRNVIRAGSADDCIFAARQRDRVGPTVRVAGQTCNAQ